MDVNEIEVNEECAVPCHDETLTVEEPMMPSSDGERWKKTTTEVFEKEPDKVPGSDLVVEEEPVQEAEDTDWENDTDHSKFPAYFERKINSIPKHNGQNIPGVERALSYCKEMLNVLSKAMRSDHEGKIDEVWADKQYKDVQDMVDRLEKHRDKLRGGTSHKTMASPEIRLVADGKCDKCNSDSPVWHDVEGNRVVCLTCNAEVGNDEMVKMAATPVINVYITAFERACVASMINGAVSQGKNIEETYNKLDKQYKFTDREKMALRQLVADYGYALPLLDRSREEKDEEPSELMKNYPA